jgi:O-antigen ligase
VAVLVGGALLGGSVALGYYVVSLVIAGTAVVVLTAIKPQAGLTALIAVSPLPYLLGIGNWIGIDPFPGIAALVWLAVLVRLATGRGSLPKSDALLPAVSVLALGAAAAFRAAPLYPSAAAVWSDGLVRPAVFLSLLWLGYYAAGEEREWPIAGLFACIVLGIVVSVYLQRLGIYAHPLSAGVHPIAEKTMGGALIASNTLGRFLAVYLAFLLPCLDWRVRGWERKAGYLAVVVGLPTLALSLNRGGMVAFAAAGVLWLLGRTTWRPSRRFVLAVLVGVLVLVMIVPGLSDYFGRTLEAISVGDTQYVTSSRDLIWAGAMRYLQEPQHLFVGGGLMDYSYRIAEYASLKTQYTAHNGYLQVLLESGLLGLLCVSWLHLVVLRRVWRARRADGAVGALASAVLLGFAALAVVNITGTVGGIADTHSGMLWFASGYVIVSDVRARSAAATGLAGVAGG